MLPGSYLKDWHDLLLGSYSQALGHELAPADVPCELHFSFMFVGSILILFDDASNEGVEVRRGWGAGC